jgi:hypothetical protein
VRAIEPMSSPGTRRAFSKSRRGDTHGVDLDVVARLRRLEPLAVHHDAGGRHAHVLVAGQEHRGGLEIGDLGQA